MRALKILVIGMGLLLVAGTLGLAFVILHRLSSKPSTTTAQIVPTHGHADVTLPAGSHLVGITAIGDRLALHVQGPGGDAILLIDPTSGTILETIELHQSLTVPQP
jgi:hypothetical protein